MTSPRSFSLPHRVFIRRVWLAATALFACASLARAAEQTFNYTGAQQNFVVPTGTTAVTVVATGGSGGDSVITTGRRLGGLTTATIPATPGETLAIFVGGAGADAVAYVDSLGGFNGGGSSRDSQYPGGGGGGASDVRQGGTALSNRVVVAGGAGGNGGNSLINSYASYGGEGGGLTADAGNPAQGSPASSGGGGGTQAAGGAAGIDNGGGMDEATPGASGQGGNGASHVTYGAGGGGGGYFGGGGGGVNGNQGNPGAGGGGGSSFAIGTATNVSLEGSAAVTGNGKVVLSFSGATIYWSGTGSGAVAGGSGTWDTANARWSTTSNGSSYAVWVNSLPDAAVFQNTAGTVTVGTGGVTVKSLSFGVSGYTLSGSTAITLTSTGTIALGAFDATITAPLAGSAGLTKTGTGTLTLGGANTFSGTTAIDAGAINLANSSGSAFGTSSVTVASGSTLTGSGSFTGPLTLAAGATLSPGNSPGLMTIGSGSLLSGTTLMEIAGLTRGTTYDAIDVAGAGALTFGGTLQVTFLDGFSPVAGNSFNLFDFNTGSSTFTTLDLPALAAGLAWDQSALYTSGTLSVSAIPEPSTYAVVFGVVALGLSGWRRRASRRPTN